MKNRVIIIGLHYSLIKDFARVALNLGEEEFWPITLEGGTRHEVLLSTDPREVNVYYLWTRPTPLYEPGARTLEIAKMKGFRPICVVDW